MKRKDSVSVKTTPCGLGVTVSMHGKVIGFIQGVDVDDLNVSAVKLWAREAVIDLDGADCTRLNSDDFIK